MTPLGLTLLLGGARSGKSALAVELGRRHHDDGGGVTYVATAPRIPGDAELDDRIAAHRGERPAWPTIEAPLELVDALTVAGDQDLVIVDCLTLWVNNRQHRGDDESAIVAAGAALATRAAARPAPTVVISNEVGWGIVPADPTVRAYRDTLGRVNALFARHAERALLLVAGRALPLADPWSCW